MNFLQKLSLLIALFGHFSVHCIAAFGQCESHQFECDNGECIAMRSLCNGYGDCRDRSDENNCNNANHPRCKKGYYQCVSHRSCILQSWVCDDEEDCDDGSDERNCPLPVCASDEFECLRNRQCITMTHRCDGSIDCDDASDELNCNGYSTDCRNNQFSCDRDQRCVSRSWLCDGEDDCDDGSDEKHCDSGSVVGHQTSVAPTLSATTQQACPENYCNENADCVVVDGQPYCNCSPPFTGEKCELQITAEQNFPDLGIVIGISTTLIILLIVIVLMLVYYCKRRSVRYSTALMSKKESQIPITSYSKE